MIGAPLKEWVIERCGTTEADKLRLATKLGVTSRTIYSMMADGKYYVYETDTETRIYKLNFVIKGK